MIQLFIGGVRSGKSDAAECLLNNMIKADQQLKPAYIATSIAMGDETIARIQKHKETRQSRFIQPIATHELDYQTSDLLTVLNSLNNSKQVVLIECLSTWVGWYLSLDNSLQENLTYFDKQQAALLSFLENAQCTVIIVTGEVGCGLIGETTLQRRYADKLGKLNQKVAALSDHVFLVTAGIKQTLK